MSRKITLIYIDAGGGHRAAAAALREVIREQQRPWDVEMVSIQDLLEPIDFITKHIGIEFQEVYNIMLRRGWTAGTAQLIPLMHLVFQICESEDSMPHMRAARKWIVLMGMVPLFGLLAPFEVYFRGWRLGLIHLSFALALALVLLNLLLLWFRKIPFKCSYFPGKTSMAVMLALYLTGFAAYSWTMADLEAALIEEPAQLLLFFAVAAASLWGLARLEKRELGVDDSLIYEDEPDPIVRSLELG